MSKHSDVHEHSSPIHRLLTLAVGGIAAGVVIAFAYEPARRKVHQWLDELGSYVDQQARRLLRLALGMDIQADQLHISLTSGAFSAQNMRLFAVGSAQPLLTVDRVEAQLRPAELLKARALMERVVLEHPVISIVRRADGSMNAPAWLLPPLHEVPEKAQELVHAAEVASDLPLGFDVRQMDMRNGEVHFRDESAGAYHVAARGIEARLARVQGGHQLTADVSSVARLDQPCELGPSHAVLDLQGIEDLSQLANARISARVALPQNMEMSLDSPSLRSRHFDVGMTGSARLENLVPMLPPNLSPLLAPLEAGGTQGDVSLDLRMNFDPAHGLRIDHIQTNMEDVAVGTPEQTQTP